MIFKFYKTHNKNTNYSNSIMLDKETKELNEIQNSFIYDFLKEDNITLFSFSSLKSRAKITLSENNFFNIKFYKNENNELKNEKNNSYNINNKKSCQLKEDYYNNSIKTLNIKIPSPEKLLQNKFQNDFMLEYNNSFANFVGINKIFFKELFINNRYIPRVNELGDINVSTKSIIDILKTYSYTLILKIQRKKINRMKKLFKTYKKKPKKVPKSIIKKNNSFKNNKIKSKFENENNKLEENHKNLYEDFKTNYFNDNIKIFNSFLKQENNSNEENFTKDNNNITLNNNIINNDIDDDYSKYIQKHLFPNYNKQKNELISNNNNEFNFFSNNVQNNINSEILNRKDFINKKRTNISNLNNIELNNNIPFNYQILNPMIFNTKENIISPCSYGLSYNNLLSSNSLAYSPFYNNIDDRFIYGHTNRNLFTLGNISHINNILNQLSTNLYKNQ